MSRYRPPAPVKSPYISASGFERLQLELRQRWQLRKEVTAALSAAAAEGDRSENAEYIYRKKQLREIDYRIRYLQKRLPNLTIVDSSPSTKEQIFFGAWVTLEDEQGKRHRYHLMGPDEIAPGEGLISIDSPMAQAMIKKKVDDEIQVQTPAGKQYYYIIKIDYSEKL